MNSAAFASPVQQLTLDLPAKKESLIPGVDVSVDYKVNTDTLQQVRPRTYKHGVGLSVSKDFWEKYTFSLGSGLDFKTLGGDVSRDTNKDQYFNLGDIQLTALRTFKKPESIHTVSLILSEDLLVSEDSRYRGYRNVTSGQALLSSKIWPRFTLKNSVSGGYILNRYKYSPISSGKTKRGDINSDGYYGYKLSGVLRILTGLNISAAVGVRGTHYLDSTNTYDFSNSYTLSYSKDSWSTYLKYINSGYSDRGETNLWFVDRYRGLAEFGATYNF